MRACGLRTRVRRRSSACVMSSRRSRVPAENILSEDVEVFAPCALGAVLNAGSIPRLGARIVAGAANNQLAEDKDGQALQAAGVLYAPDYVINAGGIISVAREYNGGTEAQVTAEIQGIQARLTEIFERARRVTNLTTNRRSGSDGAGSHRNDYAQNGRLKARRSGGPAGRVAKALAASAPNNALRSHKAGQLRLRSKSFGGRARRCSTLSP